MFFPRISAAITVITLAMFCITAGHCLASPLESAVGYRSTSKGNITVYYHPPDGRVARTYLEWAAVYQPRPDWMKAHELTSLSIYVAPSVEEFHTLSGGTLPEWGVACALPGTDVIIVRSPRIVELWREEPREILNHEITHIFLDQLMTGAEVPRWFHEGYALYVSRMWGMEDFLAFSVAVLMNRTFSLGDLEQGFPVGENQAQLAYLQSYTAVEFMFTRWNAEQIQLLFNRWRNTGDLDTALRTGLGLTLGQFENLWRDWVAVRYGWLKLLTSATLIWLAAALLFLVIFVMRRRRYNRKLAEMRQREQRLAESIMPAGQYIPEPTESKSLGSLDSENDEQGTQKVL